MGAPGEGQHVSSDCGGSLGPGATGLVLKGRVEVGWSRAVFLERSSRALLRGTWSWASCRFRPSLLLSFIFVTDVGPPHHCHRT